MTPRTSLSLLLALLSLLALPGCRAVAELSYDIAAQQERSQCEAYTAMSDRQACLQRVRTAEKQALEARKP